MANSTINNSNTRRVVLLCDPYTNPINNLPWVLGQDLRGFQYEIALDALPPGITLDIIVQGQVWFVNNDSTAYRLVYYAGTDGYPLAVSGTDTGIVVSGNTTPTTVSGTPTYYISAYDTTNQTAPSSTTAYPIGINTFVEGSGISLGTSGQLYVENTGIYNLQFSAQLVNTSSTEHNANIWLRMAPSGTEATTTHDVDFSTGQVSVPTKHGTISGQIIAAWNYVMTISGGQYVQLWYQTEDPSTSIETVAAGTSPVTPVSPSVIVTMQQITSSVVTTVISGSIVPGGVVYGDLTVSGTTTFGGPVYNLEDAGSQVYNVKAFGAKGDDVTDDTYAIQTAIWTAQASPYGGEIYFPPGSYRVSAPLIITPRVYNGVCINNGGIVLRGYKGGNKSAYWAPASLAGTFPGSTGSIIKPLSTWTTDTVSGYDPVISGVRTISPFDFLNFPSVGILMFMDYGSLASDNSGPFVGPPASCGVRDLYLDGSWLPTKTKVSQITSFDNGNGYNVVGVAVEGYDYGIRRANHPYTTATFIPQDVTLSGLVQIGSTHWENLNDTFTLTAVNNKNGSAVLSGTAGSPILTLISGFLPPQYPFSAVQSGTVTIIDNNNVLNGKAVYNGYTANSGTDGNGSYGYRIWSGTASNASQGTQVNAAHSGLVTISYSLKSTFGWYSPSLPTTNGKSAKILTFNAPTATAGGITDYTSPSSALSGVYLTTSGSPSTVWQAYTNRDVYSVDGITAIGGVNGFDVDSVFIYGPTGCGINAFGPPGNPGLYTGGWKVSNVYIGNTGSHGIAGVYGDSSWYDVHIQSAGVNGFGHGFYMTGIDMRFIGCRADLCQGMGFNSTDSSGNSDKHYGVENQYVGCSTLRNDSHGYYFRVGDTVTSVLKVLATVPGYSTLQLTNTDGFSGGTDAVVVSGLTSAGIANGNYGINYFDIKQGLLGIYGAGITGTYSNVTTNGQIGWFYGGGTAPLTGSNGDIQIVTMDNCYSDSDGMDAISWINGYPVDATGGKMRTPSAAGSSDVYTSTNILGTNAFYGSGFITLNLTGCRNNPQVMSYYYDHPVSFQSSAAPVQGSNGVYLLNGQGYQISPRSAIAASTATPVVCGVAGTSDIKYTTLQVMGGQYYSRAGGWNSGSSTDPTIGGPSTPLPKYASMNWWIYNGVTFQGVDDSSRVGSPLYLAATTGGSGTTTFKQTNSDL